jgi:TonB family protein
VALLAWSSSSGEVVAQTGPIPARIVAAAVPVARGQVFIVEDTQKSATIELTVGDDGHVLDARILDSSGDPGFDQKGISYYANWRLVPAIDTNGIPVVSTFRIGFAREIGTSGIAQIPPLDAAVLQDEPGRIVRMTCRDFLWEYDLMKQIAGKRSVNREQLLLTSFAIYIVKHEVAGDVIGRLERNRDATIHDTVDQCRTRPTEKYWTGVFEAALSARLTH